MAHHVPRLSLRLDAPPNVPVPYNLTTFASATRYKQLFEGVIGASQFAQDLWVDQALRGLRGGLVVESGAFDGEIKSNSLFSEVARGWNCLLVEANPALQEQIAQKRRRCHVLRGGLSTTPHESAFDFQMAGAVGGIVSDLGGHMGRVEGEVVKVPCYTLHRVLSHMRSRSDPGHDAAGRPATPGAGGSRLTVDFWSLDTEGSEAKILNATNFALLEVGLLVVEHAMRADSRRAVHAVLHDRHGFARVSCHDTDDYYANPSYFAARGLPLPTAAIKPPVLGSELARSWDMRHGGMTGHGMRRQRCPPS